MDLRGFASPAERKKFVQERLRAGVVVKLYCGFIDDPKPKRLVIVDPDRDRPLFFFINTEPTEFAKANRKVISQHLLLEKDKENFLDWNSWLDCSVAYDNFDRTEIEQALIDDTTRILGDLSAPAAEKVLDIITDNSPSLSPHYVNLISAQLSQLF